MSEHTPRSYGDMVMGEYLKGLAEIAKDHPSKIEQLEALEAEATPLPLELTRYAHGGGRVFNTAMRDLVADFFSKGDRDLYLPMRESFGNLLAVAKAAKCYTNADPMVRGEAYRDLCEALSRLEAQ